MSYIHDVFISYKREACWTPWTRDHFKMLLQSYLQQELGRLPDIFVDEKIDVAADWVDALGYHLARSRVMVAIFSGDYFGSEWCLHELDLMLGRSILATHATTKPHLIVPIVVHDGDLIPEPVQRLQPKNLGKYRIAYINSNTQDYHDFSKAMGAMAPGVAAAVNSAPPYDPSWDAHHQKKFNDVFAAVNSSSILDPVNFVAKRPSPPLTPPRVRP